MEKLRAVKNTAEYLPFGSVAPNFMATANCTGIVGTGFFCMIPTFDYIFYVTALHCFNVDPLKKIEIDEIKVQLQIAISELVNNAVVFDCCFSGVGDADDIIVFVVDRQSHTNEELIVLEGRSLVLGSQGSIDYVIQNISIRNEKIRTIGYPSVDGKINSVDWDTGLATVQSRGFFGCLSLSESVLSDGFVIKGTNWTEGEYRGFSGAPVLALLPDIDDNDIVNIRPVLIGMILMAKGVISQCVSANVITDLIAVFIRRELDSD